MKPKFKSFCKRGIAVGMMAVMAFMLPATPLHESEVKAAEVHSTGEYIKEVKLFVMKGGTLQDAEAKCASLGDGWKVINGGEGTDYNLNAGASDAFTKEVGVYLCYQTTTDPDEAITDLAVINERGGYSTAEYERLLKNQKDAYIDMVKNMKTMIEEYRKNYGNKVPIAVKAHDFLNIYEDTDTGNLLGDILLTADDDKLADILLQSNGTVVLTMQEKLASACDTAKTTWLDRMAKLGSFDKLKNAFSQNMSGGDVEKAMEKQYRESAVKLLNNWDDLSTRIKGLGKIIEDNGLSGASADQLKTWAENLEVTDPAYASYHELMIISTLANYKYGDKTLFDFFSKTKAQVEKDGIETLYPMAACLTKGQLSALDESIGLFQLVQDAMASSIVNENKAGIISDIKEDKNGSEALAETKEAIDEVDMMIAKLGEKKISIYEGVDRDVFKGGVAVTTDAENASAGSENSWTDLFINKKGNVDIATIAMGAGAVATAIFAGLFAYAASIPKEVSLEFGVSGMDAFDAIRNGTDPKIANLYSNATQNCVKQYSSYGELMGNAGYGDKVVDKAYDEILKYSDPKLVKARSAFFNKLKIGMAAFTVLISVADIALTAYSLYRYYNVDHLSIPDYMVSLTYSETTEASYVAYRSVRDQDGKCGDLNGNNAKQWLALYYTKDKKAGAPILAPGSNNEWVYQTGDNRMPGLGYTPLHEFGWINVPQNLTFADGEEGYSYNDKNNGVYLFFSHANTKITYLGKDDDKALSEEDTAQTAEDESQKAVSAEEAQAVSGSAAEPNQAGTAVTGGIVALVGVVGLVAGGFGGFVIANTRRRKLMR